MNLFYRLAGIWDYNPVPEQRMRLQKSIWHNARGNGSTEVNDIPPDQEGRSLYAPIIRLALEHRVIRQMVRDISRYWERMQG